VLVARLRQYIIWERVNLAQGKTQVCGAGIRGYTILSKSTAEIILVFPVETMRSSHHGILLDIPFISDKSKHLPISSECCKDGLLCRLPIYGKLQRSGSGVNMWYDVSL